MDLPKLLVDLLAEPRKPTQWLIEHLVPAAGKVLLYGKTSIGKSPVTWKIAQAISEGGDFFGYPVRVTGPVLYIEVDTPKDIAVERLQHLVPRPSQVYFTFKDGVDVVNPTPQQSAEFKKWNEEIKPVLVIWNVLNKMHRLEGKDANTVSRVYEGVSRQFPNSSHLIVHHDKKMIWSKDVKTDEDEAFSGSGAWLDLAIGGLHLIKDQGWERGLQKLKLVHTKSGAGEKQDTIHFTLAANGTELLEPDRPVIMEKFEALSGISNRKKFKLIADELQISETAIKNYLRKRGVIGKVSQNEGDSPSDSLESTT